MSLYYSLAMPLFKIQVIICLLGLEIILGVYLYWRLWIAQNIFLSVNHHRQHSVLCSETWTCVCCLHYSITLEGRKWDEEIKPHSQLLKQKEWTVDLQPDFPKHSVLKALTEEGRFVGSQAEEPWQMLRSDFLCSLAFSNEPHVAVVMRVGGRAGQSSVRELKARKVKPLWAWPTRGMGPLTRWMGYCCCFPSPRAFPDQRKTVPAWRAVLSSHWDFSCYVWLKGWKSWLINYSSLSSKHSFAQLFSHLRFCAAFVDLLRDFPTICKAWVHLGAVWGDRTWPEVQWMSTCRQPVGQHQVRLEMHTW